MEIKLKAGRELDALIAEKVFGWTWKEIKGYDHDIKSLVPPDSEQCSHIPYYSSEIVDAWKVVEKLRIDKFLCFALRYHNIDPDLPAEAEFDACEPGKCYAAQAETVPEAICSAALRAVGYYDPA